MAELDALRKAHEAIRAAGASLVAISPLTAERAAEVVAQRKLDFPLLRDEGNAYAEALGLRHGFPDDLREVYQGFGIDLPVANGDPSWTLPMPARYVVRADGTVADVQVHPDYTRRPEPSHTLDVLASL